MTDPITPDALRVAIEADVIGQRHNTTIVSSDLLRAAADRIEALTDERDEAVALLRDWPSQAWRPPPWRPPRSHDSTTRNDRWT